ncbi:restriction endonuclease subunit S [Sphingomonas sp. CFBP 13706]|uniref:restriction endonuclease subunit S n=1 Tax=Sphingomonas sp. CFBP 13706 TaxID=2775314 RepID=UPI00178345B4|nr:restriction endonuclease subunit S [Sphingomonas sp. CFBP 13706]
MSVTTAKIGEVARQVRGVTYAGGEAIQEPRDGYLPLMRANNITEHGLSTANVVFVPKIRVSPAQMLRSGDILVATSSGSLSVVGKAARVKADEQATFGAFCKVVRPGERVDPGYLSHFFQTDHYRRRVSALAAGANINNLRNEHIDDLELALLPLADQRRIAAILDKADAIRARRRVGLADADALARATFLNLFGDPVSNPMAWPEMRLDEIADVRSGITKGRKPSSAPARPVPYMRVANVQDSHLDLSEIKTIDATEAEIARFALQAGDILLTEGGDPDKLGRGAVWAGELAECIHQNHIFMVRVRDAAAMPPAFLSALIGSARGKRYFLKNAKQTTGIASINRTQLAAFPALVPDPDVLTRWAVANRGVERARSGLITALADADALYASLATRAFRGEL